MPRSPPSPPPPCVFPAPPPPLPAPLPADINRQHEMNSRRVGGKKQKVSEEGSTTEEPTDRAKKRRSSKEELCQSEQWIIPATKKEWSARLEWSAILCKHRCIYLYGTHSICTHTHTHTHTHTSEHTVYMHTHWDPQDLCRRHERTSSVNP